MRLLPTITRSLLFAARASSAGVGIVGSANAVKKPSFSAPPGTAEVEDQTPLAPLGPHCNVLVVGGTRGIGLEFCRQLTDKKCNVIATHREAEPPPALASLGAKTLRMDVADEASIAAAAASLRADGVSLTHIVHNAGIYGPKGTLDGRERQGRAAAPPVTKEHMLQTFEINAIGPLLVAQNFAPLLAPSGAQTMPVLAILTSKVGSIDDNGSGGAYAYRTSKAAVNQIAKSLYIDLEEQATVVLLHPGFVQTDMTNGAGLITADVSVAGLLKAIEATGPETPFRFVDFAGKRIPW
jgi:NAD(P)-dependent dehydrogenase (short-subunit alcohol dehydrogenase family)